MNATLTKAYNGIKSTLSYGAQVGSQALYSGRQAFGSVSKSGYAGGGLAGRTWAGMSAAGTSLGSSIAGSSWKGRAMLGTTATGAAMTGVAGADFLNPWGLGWGD